MKYTFFTLIILCFLTACDTSKKVGQKNKVQQLDLVQEMMTGSFSSTAQSIRDTTYFDISLTMHPIWSNELDSKWLYVEQAVSSMMQTPYRQRVYQLSMMDDGTVASKVYELPEPKKYVHAWENENLFNEINPSSLVEREGCTVYLKKDAKSKCYTGSTKDKECLSSLRGATYATSIVTVCEDGIQSWDQGWNGKDKQVWGATKAGYVFDRK